MLVTCYSLKSLCSRSLGTRPLCVRTTVAGRAGTLSSTATMKSEVSGTANNKHLPLLDRIMCRVWQESNSGCWLWLGAVNHFQMRRDNPRPLMRYNGKPNVLVYRLTYELFNGPIRDGLWVLHRCDNPICVNPSHLWLGTNSDNMKDCAAKGRHPMLNNPAIQVERARQLGLRNTWSKGRKIPNRKRPMKKTMQLSLAAVRQNWGAK